MRPTVLDRLEHISEAIRDIRTLLAGKTIEVFETERATRAAFERYIEILSEASRHIPGDLKTRFPHIPWNDIANIGNHLRHSYDGVDIEILWNVYLYEASPRCGRAISNTPPSTPLKGFALSDFPPSAATVIARRMMSRASGGKSSKSRFAAFSQLMGLVSRIRLC